MQAGEADQVRCGDLSGGGGVGTYLSHPCLEAARLPSSSGRAVLRRVLQSARRASRLGETKETFPENLMESHSIKIFHGPAQGKVHIKPVKQGGAAASVREMCCRRGGTLQGSYCSRSRWNIT